ncbi:sensor histidine kinase [Cellulomonas dongxiuzhuiae]|uniref:sensor histidine kinase n=1 Tax=Cellulomonas dongxiuzhuiae TaxID=2819979 RepID=UPI001AAF4D84|nr:HAMP domain-containing sensor histidine kinase [Cellulomonas dongxiuzhuiae]MBO3087783.1 HAMP domain-containing histidine kinase [Cellulomonas dongxiuzhuiae]
MTSGPEPHARHVRGDSERWRLPDVRPLDPLRSIKMKLGVLVAATVTLAAFVIWVGYGQALGPSRTLPLAIALSLVVTQILARGMTSPLREMTEAARAMAGGDYSRRVRSTSRDEVGQLAEAFNTMADDLQQLDTFRRELVANVSHELRTPVTALQAVLENMVDGVSEPDPATLQVALAQTERLSRLVSSLLDLSRVEAGAMDLRLEEVHVGELLRQAADEASLVGADKHLHFSVDVEPADLTVPADPERLHQVVANLLQNAARHSPPDEEVRVVARRDGHDVRVDVIDRGPGIARDQRAHVFERFVRGNTPALTGQGSTGGTGLGLAIVRWAVELHGGSVAVADSASGCTMRVLLPAEGQARRGGLPRTRP